MPACVCQKENKMCFLRSSYLLSLTENPHADLTICLYFSMAMSIQVLLSLDRVDLARYCKTHKTTD